MTLIEELVALLKQATFVVESVAHLQGKERELLPLAQAARKLIEQAEGRAYRFDVVTGAGNYTLRIDTAAQHGYFEHNELGDESAGELTFGGGELVDYDGVFALPPTVAEELRRLGYHVDEYSEADKPT
jgi:hypothetical protein